MHCDPASRDNCKNSDTGLHLAVLEGHLDIVQFFISNQKLWPKHSTSVWWHSSSLCRRVWSSSHSPVFNWWARLQSIMFGWTPWNPSSLSCCEGKHGHCEVPYCEEALWPNNTKHLWQYCSALCSSQWSPRDCSIFHWGDKMSSRNCRTAQHDLTRNCYTRKPPWYRSVLAVKQISSTFFFFFFNLHPF